MSASGTLHIWWVGNAPLASSDVSSGALSRWGVRLRRDTARLQSRDQAVERRAAGLACAATDLKVLLDVSQKGAGSQSPRIYHRTDA